MAYRNAESGPILFVSMDGKGVKPSDVRAHAARMGHQKSREKTMRDLIGKASASPEQTSTNGRRTLATKVKTRKKPIAAKADSNSSHATPALVRMSSRDSDQSHMKIDESSHQNAARDLMIARQRQPSPSHLRKLDTMPDRFVGMFFQTMLPSYTAAYDMFNVPNIIKVEWPLYMNHEVFLWTEAAAIQGLYEHLQGQAPSEKVFTYKAKALTCLKKELLQRGGKLDDYLVMSIFVLASLDLMAGDDVGHNLHKKMLRTAFYAAGGLHTYGAFVRNTTMRLDSFWRSTSDEPTTPEVPRLLPSRAPTFPSHPFSPEISSIISQLPDGFEELALDRKLPLDILEILGRLVDPSQKPLGNRVQDDNRSPCSKEGMYPDFWEACPSLSATSSTDPSSSNRAEPPLERLLALSLLIHASNRNATNPLRMYNCITNGAIFELIHDLPQCVAQRSKDEEHCLFWIWSVAVDATRDRTGRLSPQGVKLAELQQKRFPGVVGTEMEVAVLRRFWLVNEDPSERARNARGELELARHDSAVSHRQSEAGSPRLSAKLPSLYNESTSGTTHSLSVTTPWTEPMSYYDENTHIVDGESHAKMRMGIGQLSGVKEKRHTDYTLGQGQVPALPFGKLSERSGYETIRMAVG